MWNCITVVPCYKHPYSLARELTLIYLHAPECSFFQSSVVFSQTLKLPSTIASHLPARPRSSENKKTARENHRERQSIESITKYENITADGLWSGDCFYRWRKLYLCVERFDNRDGAFSPFSMKTKPALFILSKRRNHRLEPLVELAGAAFGIHIALFARIDGMRGRRRIQRK